MQNNSFPPLTVPVIRPSNEPLPPTKTEIDKAKAQPVSAPSAGYVPGPKQMPGWLSQSVSESKKNGKASPNTLDFNLIRKFTHIQTTPENTNNDDAGSAITFSRSKDEIGGTDLGMLGKVDGEEFLIKTGLGRGVLNQITNHFLKGDMKRAEKKAGFIVRDYIRMVGANPDPDQQKPLQNALFDSLKIFFSSADGETILNKAKEKKIDISDVNKIHSSLVAQNPNLRNVLSVPILMDVINGTTGQQLANDYQRTYLESHQIPNSKLFLVGSNPLIGSQFLQDAVPFDKFLSKNFLPEGKTLEDVRHASELIEKAGKGDAVDADELEASRQLLLIMTTPENLAAGKARLIAQLKEEGLEGLFASILMRLTMGEKGDLGPDNMLVVKGKNGHNQVVNIDITGFRYDRENDFQLKPEDKPAFGWKDIIQNPDTAPEKLLDGSVFSGRYLVGIDAVQHAVADALREAVGDQAPVETKKVRDWYASLDSEASKSSLKDLAQNLSHSLDASVAPDDAQMHKAIARNCSFIDSAVRRSRDRP